MTGNLKMRSEPTKSEKKPELQKNETLPDKTPSQDSDSVEWYFDDYQNDNAVITCNKFLDLIKSIVTAIQTKFP